MCCWTLSESSSTLFSCLWDSSSVSSERQIFLSAFSRPVAGPCFGLATGKITVRCFPDQVHWKPSKFPDAAQ